jgi:superfamily II DNA or RNA helicase
MENEFPINQKIRIPGHFEEPVTLEGIRQIGACYECRVRLSDGSPDETILSADEASALLGAKTSQAITVNPEDSEKIRILVESARIRLAYAHDKHFAVSLSGIRTLPHQIEAVYEKMLPQPRLRFLLADDPGAGKTIMAGLLIKELKLREAVERILIVCPAPLTIQWQDEMIRWFGEQFEIIFSELDQQQLVNPWQRANQVIVSLDYAKQDEVRERIWQQRWDLVIIDEAHKCSAHSKGSTTQSVDVEKTKRYQLAEKLASQTDLLLLLTATPHHGDDDRFAHFIRLIDPDLFPEPNRLVSKASEIRQDILRLGPDCPWALRRLKEDLKDVNGQRLFSDRHAHTVTFQLNRAEYDLYRAVTGYINEFFPHATGRKKQSVALVRTVFQRRLASSTHAICESIRRRLEKQKALLDDLEKLSPSERAKRLAQMQKKYTDDEQDEDDLDDDERDQLIDEFTTAGEIIQLKAEIAVLTDRLGMAKKVADNAGDSKVSALRECLKKAEFDELKDGRGKLLIFTEHRDTLEYLRRNLEQWGYSTCEIHGSMNPHERKRAQEEFRTTRQICVATEAAGEGINLQFCRLMINYDIPWNPTRLEQRLGRIHRIGQERDVHAFNFVASSSEDGSPIIEGLILERLLQKMDNMRAVLNDRIFDVIGEVLSLNDVNLPEMLREAVYDPHRLSEYLNQIEQVDPKRLLEYERMTGIALARANVDFSSFQRANIESEERRLMPEYVEKYFINTCKELGLRLESRADGLLRLDYVPADLRSERYISVKKMGKPESSYKKLTFHKHDLDLDQHMDAILIGPGHALYSVIDERMNEINSCLNGGVGFFTDPFSETPYRLHFFELSIRGQNTKGEQQTIYGELVAVKEELTSAISIEEKFSVVPADCLLDLPILPSPPQQINPIDPAPASDFLKSSYQAERRRICQEERQHFVEVCRDYLQKSFNARIRAAQDRVMNLRARERESTDYALAATRAMNDLTDLQRTQLVRMTGLNRLEIVKPGPVRHIATAVVYPVCEGGQPQIPDFCDDMDPDTRRRSELAAEDLVVAFEEQRGWECERVGHLKIGFDVRSLGPADAGTGYRDPVAGVRRIEVKGRSRGQPIRLTTNEWYKAAQLGDTYWLYVVWDPLGKPDPEPMIVQNPVKHLDHAKREIVAARFFEIPAQAIEEAVKRIKGA